MRGDMAIEKPAPIQIGDRYMYTLTSYEPVTVELKVPSVTDADVDLAVEQIIATRCKDDEKVDDAWIAANFEGLSGMAALREDVRGQISTMNTQMVEDSKTGRCVAELAKRLGQSVPQSEIAQMRQVVQMRLEQDLAMRGISMEEFLAAGGGASQASLDAMLDADARAAAEGDAALDAYAAEKKLEVNESEYAALLGVDQKTLDDVMADARKAGQSERVRESALRAKAARVLTAEASITYSHETAEEAEARIDRMRQMAADRKAE